MAHLRIAVIGLVWIAVCGLHVQGDMKPYATIEELTDKADIIIRGSQELDDLIRVVKVYKGQAESEIILTRWLSGYQTSVYPVPRKPDRKRPADVGTSDLIVFLVSGKDGKLYPALEGAGIKRIHDGRVYRYYRSMNEYELRVSYETETDYDSPILYESGDPLTADMLEAYIATSIRRSKHFINAASLPDSEARVRALLTYLRNCFGHSTYYGHKALDALVEIGESALPMLLFVLRAETCNLPRYEVISRLGRIGSASAVPFLLQELESSTPRCRVYAARSLGDLEAKEAVDLLCSTLDHTGDNQLTMSAIYALGRIGDRRATLKIVEFLLSGYSEIRKEALDSLSRLKDQASFEYLVEALGEPLRKGDIRFRDQALILLYELDKARGTPVFIEHLLSAESEVVHRARLNLRGTFGELMDFEDYDAAKAWYDRQPKDENGVVILERGR